MRENDKRPRIGIHAALIWAVLGTQGFAQAAEELPAFVNWSLDGAYGEDNGLRSRVVLNGHWQLRFPDREGVYYRRVPGGGVLFAILDREGNDLLKTIDRKDVKDVATSPCFLERQFRLPEAWKGKHIRLVLENVVGEGEVWLDGQSTGCTWPMRPHHLDLPEPVNFDRPYTLKVKCSGVAGNVWLAAYASQPLARITDAYLMTSVRNMEGVLRASGTGPDGCGLRIVITDYEDPTRTVKTVGPFAGEGDGKTWKIEHRFPWEDAKLWSLDHPNLYQYYVEMLDADGKVIDRIFPIRFGFREVWIKDGAFMLNNHRVTLTMNIHTVLGHGPEHRYFGHTSGHIKLWKEIIRQHKRLGLNTMVYRNSANEDAGALFRAADEEGFFLSAHLRGQQRGDPEHMAIPTVKQHREDIDVALLKAHRHSPCVPFYYLGSVHNTWDYEFKKLGEDYDVETLTGRHVRPEKALVDALDPARVAFAGGGGGKDQSVHSSMNYIPIDADLQVHETWPSHWYARKRKPLATYEMAAPSYIGNWHLRRSRGSRRGLPFFLEVSAITFGEAPYLTEPRETVKRWLTSVATKKGGVSPGWPKWEVDCYERAAKLFAKNVYRSWRTYGVNMGLFTQVRSYFQGDPVPFEPEDRDPRTPGMSMDRGFRLYEPLANREPLSEVGLVAQKALSPLLMYIGGADGEFTLKDHAYFAGENVRKAVVILNDRGLPILVSGAWELADARGKVILSGAIPETRLEAGELAPAKVHLQFTAPRVAQRTEFTIRLKGKAAVAGSLDDEFGIVVFPRPDAPELGEEIRVFLYDPVGETKELLDQASIRYSPLGGTLPDPENSLVVIGRNALKDKAHRRGFHKLTYARMGYGFSVNVSNGLRVLVFEQAMDNVWGLKTEQTRWRRAFIRAPGHPVLDGLGKGDLLYLRGHSDLVAPDPDPPPCKAGRVGADRTTEWGNDNVVTTFTYIKPQLGAMRALVDCGFDLQETPLLEAAGGRGRLLFCQIDVTNRYGVDPVSTILVNNMLRYMTTTAPPDPAIGKPIDLVREGWEDYDVDVKEEKGLFMADKPDGPISWGISAADLYFQGFVDIPAFQGEGGKRTLYGQVEGEKAFAHTMSRRKFNTRWQKMKTMVVRSALRINQGSSSDTFPNTMLQDDGEELYPIEWIQGFVHPYLYMNW